MKQNKELKEVRKQKKCAIKNGKWELAANLRLKEKRLMKKLGYPMPNKKTKKINRLVVSEYMASMKEKYGPENFARLEALLGNNSPKGYYIELITTNPPSAL